MAHKGINYMSAKELAYADFVHGDGIQKLTEFLAHADAKDVLEFILHCPNPIARENARAQLDFLLAEKSEKTAKITKIYTIALFFLGFVQIALML
ncbi:MAG TPA: hypothetical protein VMU30_07500, partial [Bacteroidota bacterium]|nr:hypothetical protein [Bacteroidota bacterium]